LIIDYNIKFEVALIVVSIYQFSSTMKKGCQLLAPWPLNNTAGRKVVGAGTRRGYGAREERYMV
jgi:hypothetical protein